MYTRYDLSHAITELSPCSFTTLDSRPGVSFEEGDSHGMFFITSRLDNLHSNTCTHIDFPGHISTLSHAATRTVGEYPLDRFVGPVLVLDFSHKIEAIRQYFDAEGLLQVGPRDDKMLRAFIQSLGALEVTRPELERAALACGMALETVKGCLFYTGLGTLWKYRKFESWQYLYFYSPYLSADACEMIVQSGVSFVGIDAFQLEHPIINFRGDELPLVLNPSCRKSVAEKLAGLEPFCNHQLLLSHDVLIYENLRMPKALTGRVVEFSGAPLNFQLPGLNDNALARPYVTILENLQP